MTSDAYDHTVKLQDEELGTMLDSLKRIEATGDWLQLALKEQEQDLLKVTHAMEDADTNMHHATTKIGRFLKRNSKSQCICIFCLLVIVFVLILLLVT